MTQEQIKQLEKELWDAADSLRANSKLTAAEYKDPVLGLVLLRFAQNRYEEATPIVQAKIPDGPRGKRAATKEDYLAAGAIMLPEKAKYEYLANLPESKDIAEAINNAMKIIEDEYPDLEGNLPKNYQEFEKDLLNELIRVFNKDAVKKATGDVFGRIYEYFLMKFSMQGAGAQEGGEFFTPPSLVQLIVNFIQPDHGIIHDPACGSGGMFVQTGYFVQGHTNKEVNEAITCYGTEQKTNNTRLAKINLAIHGIEGKIIEANSFYSDPHNLLGKCDFVMANPPFNVSKVDKGKDFVKTDPRLPFGLPKSDNANYMWMQYFYSYLNETGRAGFVMASSATDAGHSEKLIRQQLIETEAVDCIVSVSNNFFYTRSLPCHLWFYDKGKKPENKKTILMLDARNVFRKVTTTINDFSEGQLINLTTLINLYRNNTEAYAEAYAQYQKILFELLRAVNEKHIKLIHDLNEISLKHSIVLSRNYEIEAILPADYEEAQAYFNEYNLQVEEINLIINQINHEVVGLEKEIAKKPKNEKDLKAKVIALKQKITILNKPVILYATSTQEYYEQIKQTIKDWEQFMIWFENEKYQDIEGLCKIVTIDEVAENDYSLTPGRYVGVTLTLDNDFDYLARLLEIQEELNALNTEATQLSKTIADNLKELV